MENSPARVEEKQTQRIQLGTSTFKTAEQHQFGQNVRLAMACMEGSAEPLNIKAIPSNINDILQRLKMLSQDVTSSLADLVELIVRFDELKGWKASGAKHCAAWMNLEIGISRQLGWEYLRVGRKLRTLPTTTALFRAGKISWSKVRLIVNVADKENEKTLCHAALDGSVSEVKRLCDGYRWQKDKEVEGDANARAVKQWQSRSLTWQETSIGSTRIQLTLPPELAQAFLNSIDYSLSQLYKRENGDGDSNHSDSNGGDNNGSHNADSHSEEGDNNSSETGISQRRADAAILMAENSLQQAGREIATADRYQVIMSVDATDLILSPDTADVATSPDITDEHTSPDTADETAQSGAAEIAVSSHNHDVRTNHVTPSKRPRLKGAGPVARETALRLSCDCSLSTYISCNGEPMDIGRKSRIWTNGQSRGIKERDEHCQFPGCNQVHRLENHHLDHWANGGKTSVSNGTALCPYHHMLVHEGGYTVERVADSKKRMDEQFEQQTRSDDTTMFKFEKDLRNDRESFDTIRKLSPTRYRFRFKDAQGVEVRAVSEASDDINRLHENTSEKSDSPTTYQHHHSTRVECSEPKIGSYLLDRIAVSQTRIVISPD